jgi:hypothetical protein
MSAARRSTIYFLPEIYRALRLKAATTDQPVSTIVNDTLRRAFEEDVADLAAARARRREKPVSFESVVAGLKRRGKV